MFHKFVKFIKKYKFVLLVIIVAWIIIFMLNYYLKNREIKLDPIVTYKPNTSVMTDEKVPDSIAKENFGILEKYLDFCNEKEFQKAYDLLNEKCKANFFPEYKDYERYISNEFSEKKIYDIQTYSVVENVYIYRVRVVPDIMTTGTTGMDAVYYKEDMYVVEKTKDGDKLSIKQFISDDPIDYMHEDEYAKIRIINKKVTYETETYKVLITNKTKDTMVLLDNTETKEILMDIGGEHRIVNKIKLKYSLVIKPNQSKEIELEFPKFFDEHATSESIIFNAIRFLPNYSGNPANKESEMQNATKLYGIEMKLN